MTLRGCGPETVRAIHVEAARLDVSPSEYVTRLVALYTEMHAALRTEDAPVTETLLRQAGLLPGP